MLIRKKINSVKNLHVYVHDTIQDFGDYHEMVEEFDKLKKTDIVTVHLNTPGGDCSVGFFLIDQLQSLECAVNVEVDYPSYSMGAITALCGDSLTFQPDTYIMFHDYSGGMNGKGEETYMYSTNFRKVFKDRFTRICYPFLSKSEINNMFKGEDIYIHWDDPTLQQRIKRHFK